MSKDLPTAETESVDICSSCHQSSRTPTAACSHGAAGENDPLVGTIFADRYEILRLIGEGGMGKVYKAKHQLMKRLVAIKVLHPELVLEIGMLRRFQREAESASRLNHPNVVAVHDFGLSPTAYLVMDYLEGISLEDLLATHTHLDFERSLRIFVQACAGLAHAHQNSIIHRDLKPSNIMLVKSEGQPDLVKIVDFGIAKVILQGEAENNQLTLNGEILGSPHYMSPEQCHGKQLDTHSDIYSLGCVMYRTLTGIQPVDGQSLLECMYKHVYSTPELFKNVCSELNLSEAVEALIVKAMAKEQQARFKSMLELKEALESLQVGTVAGAEALNAAAREVAPMVPEQSESLAITVSQDRQPEAGSSSSDQSVTRHEAPNTNLKITAGASSRIASAAEAGRAASAVEAGLVASAAESCRAASAAEAGFAANAQEAGRVAAAAETKRAASAVEAGFAAVANEAGLAALAAESARTAAVAESERAASVAELRRAAAASELERVAAAAEVGRVVAAAEAERASAASEAGRAAAAAEVERAAAAAESGRVAQASEAKRAAGAAEVGRAAFAAEVERAAAASEAERAASDNDE